MGKSKREIGTFNEKLAQEFLIKLGYEILDKNFFTTTGEIDIIAKKENLLVFVEVRSRSYNSFGKPFETINKAKIKKIIKTSQAYISKNNLHNFDVRFDVISIENGELIHIKSAFDLDYL